MKNVEIKFKGIKVPNLILNELEKSVKKGAEIEFHLTSNVLINPNKSEILVKLKIIGQEKKGNKQVLGEITTICTYEIQDLTQFPVKDKKIKLPSELMSTLLSLSISTSRGTLYAKAAGTILEHTILPIMDPKVLLPQPNEV